MYQLRVFGGLRLEGPSGPITGRAAQRRRLALLTRLALARGAPLTRDLLCGLLWPESRDEQARRSLSAALYDLRRVLGEAALPAAGEDVRLEPSLVACDAVAFEDAALAGRLEEAASIYAGPLLEGVYFGTERAEEWERWLDGERSRLGRLYATVLDRLAEAREAAGDVAGTVDVLLCLGREDPYGARTVMRLMNALNRSGERARAIRQARVYASRVRTDLEAEPDPAVLELERQLRSEPPAGPSARARAVDAPVAEAGAPRGGPTPAIGLPSPAGSRWRTGPRLAFLLLALLVLVSAGGYALLRARSSPADVPGPAIAVLPFANLSGDAETGYFVEGIGDDLRTRLSRVPRLQVISRISVVRYRNTTKPVQQIGLELGATHVLEGTIRREGDRVRINAQLIDARTDRHLWAERYDRDLRQILEVQSEIAQAIAAALAATLTPEQRATLASGGTSDALAFDQYVRGQQYAEVNRYDSARAAFGRAVTIDPGYAQPHAALAWLYARSTAEGPLWLRDSATAEARRALELDPRSTTARRALAALYLGLGQFADAEKMTRAALAIDANDVGAMNLLSQALAAQRRMPEFLDVRLATLRLDPMNGETFYLLGWLFEKAGQRDAAIRAERRALELGYSGAYGSLAQFYLFAEDHARARAIADTLEAIYGRDMPASVGIRAELAAREGNWREAERLIRRPFVVSAESGLFPAYVALKLGQRARADSLLAAYEQELRKREAAGFPNPGARVRLAAVRGDRTGAITKLRQMLAAGYFHCLPRRTLYYESLDGDPEFEALRQEMCAAGAEGRRELERSGAWAELMKAVGSAPGTRRR